MKLYDKAKMQAKTLKPFVAQHPKTGLWYGIDRILRIPVTNGFKTKQEAQTAWQQFVAVYIADVATQDYNLD